MRLLNTIYSVRVACLSAMAFLLIASYAMARPAIDSLFLEHHSTSELPVVWLMSAGLAAAVIGIYNHFNTRHSLLTLYGAASCLIAGMFALLILGYQNHVPGVVFLLYIWKDVYIVVLNEIFWSFSNTVFSIQSARGTYGILLASGSAGGFIASLSVGYLAHAIGTASTLWFLCPILLLACLISVVLAKNTDDIAPSVMMRKSAHFGQSLEVLWRSKYLVPMFALMGIVQVSITLVDYAFNVTLQSTYQNIDMRTDVIGKVHAVTDVIAFTMQLLAGPILRLLGVAGTLIGIPTIVVSVLLGYVLLPRLGMMIAAKIASKCFDYSIFRAAKEILYIPLSQLEKTQGKALIDIFMYRLARGLSSILLISLISTGIIQYVVHITCLLLIVWLLLTYMIVKRYRKLVTIEEEREIYHPRS